MNGLPGGLAVAGPWTTKTDFAYRHIRRQILDGVLAPGAVIEQESMAAELGLSTTPLREALRRLEAEGLLHQIAHREMRVPELSITELEDLYALRLKLEVYAAQLGAKHATAEQRDHVAALVRRPPAPTKLDQLEQNRALHRAMYAAGGNRLLIQILDQLWDKSDRYRAILLRDDAIAETVHAEHLELVDAFVSGAAATLARMVRAHLKAGREKLRADFASRLA